VRNEVEKEEGMVEGILNPRSRRRAPFNPSPTIHSLHKPLSYHVTSYKGKRATKQVKKLQKVDPMSQQRNASDYIFHTQFQQDLYETMIMDRRKIMLEAQWVDWHHMEAQQDPIYNQVIDACESHHLKNLMGVHYDWNMEVIA
jgi:AraC-like DNA-binding protein